MQLKLYRAPDLRQAMSRLRAELGPEALILATRRVADGVELTAALEPEPEVAAPAPRLARADPGLLACLAFHGVPQSLADLLAAGPLPDRLSAAFAFGRLPIEDPARPVLLAGPPGAGKTLTVVRLATRLVMSGVAPMVITTDGKRAGAIEQLAAFTRLLGLTLIAADQPVMLGRALARRVGTAPVLIDTPGCDPFDPAQLQELATLAAVADAETALVLAAGIDAAEAADVARGFAESGARLLVATRLDLARRAGGVLQAASAGRLALAEAGIGPGAADGLVPMTPEFLAERLLKPVAERCNDP